MNTQLSELEAHVIGCLIEKQLTTPDQYPLRFHVLQSLTPESPLQGVERPILVRDGADTGSSVADVALSAAG